VLTVAIDGLALSDGSQYRGIGTYLRELINGLSEHEVQPVVLADASATVPSTARHELISRRLPARWRSREHERRLPRDVVRSGAAVLHTPAQLPPRRSQVPWVHTLHDLTPLVFRHPLLERDRRHWLAVGPRLRAANAVICVSGSTADQLSRLFAVDRALMHVVPLGVTQDFRPDGPRVERSPFVLWVSAWGPHKGLAEAVAVVAELADAGLPHRLVVAGRQDPWMSAQVRDTIGRGRRPDLVDVAGYVADMPTLYRGADAVIVSSRAEGFGLPALEAMACGIPVVAFDNTSLPEVVGTGGVLVPDGDVAAMADAVRRVVSEASYRQELSAAASEHATGFTWARTVGAHAEVYRAVAEAG